MKILTKDYCFINKIDIPNLTFFKYKVPKEIYDKAFPSGMPIVTEYNEYDFIEVDMVKHKEFVDTIRNADWIIDFQDLNDAHSRELLELYKGYEIQRRLIIRKFHNMDYSEKLKSAYLKRNKDILEYKMKTVGDYLYYRLGQVKIDIPEVAKKRIVPKSKTKKITDIIYRKK